jgi:hypothetical protein
MDEFWAKAGVFTSKVTYLYYINIMLKLIFYSVSGSS